MVKELYLGLFAAIVCALAALTLALPVGIAGNSVVQNGSLAAEQPQEVTLADDGSIRSERSTNLSHITGSARKIQMYVKNRHLQILPDGTVNGTSDDTSDYTILQRTTVNVGQLKIQGVATCQYLCMDSCGLLYGSKEFLDECIFNEMMEQHHYNTYSSARYSNTRRTMYLALNRRGQPRKVQIRANQQLGKLSTYTRVLTKPVNVDRVEDLMNRLLHASESMPIAGPATTVAIMAASLPQVASAVTTTTAQGAQAPPVPHPLRHHGGHLCATSQIVSATQDQRLKHPDAPPDSTEADRTRCRRKKRKKKRRRKCHEMDEDVESCHKRAAPFDRNVRRDANDKFKKCLHDKNNDECQRVERGELVTIKKKRKQKFGDKQSSGLRGVKKKRPKPATNKKLANKMKLIDGLGLPGSGTIARGGDTGRGVGRAGGRVGAGRGPNIGNRAVGAGKRFRNRTAGRDNDSSTSGSDELESTMESPRAGRHSGSRAGSRALSRAGVRIRQRVDPRTISSSTPTDDDDDGYDDGDSGGGGSHVSEHVLEHHEPDPDLEADEDYSGLLDNSTVTTSLSMEENSTWDESTSSATDDDALDDTSVAPRLSRTD